LLNRSHVNLVTLQVEVNGRTTNNDQAVKIVAGAADGLCGATISANSNHRERRASETDLTSDGSENDSKQPGKETDARTVCILDAVAALKGPSIALGGLAGDDGLRGRSGSRKESEQEEEADGRYTGKHCNFDKEIRDD